MNEERWTEAQLGKLGNAVTLVGRYGFLGVEHLRAWADPSGGSGSKGEVAWLLLELLGLQRARSVDGEMVKGQKPRWVPEGACSPLEKLNATEQADSVFNATNRVMNAAAPGAPTMQPSEEDLALLRQTGALSEGQYRAMGGKEPLPHTTGRIVAIDGKDVAAMTPDECERKMDALLDAAEADILKGPHATIRLPDGGDPPGPQPYDAFAMPLADNSDQLPTPFPEVKWTPGNKWL